ncbi:hypothetical protein HX004_14145 [Myroides sp. 1354]|uniref:hypothetical protein n=1 Tax=unclassified Myroides TaxID=2642485 RepID=UPI0025778049|nr:MULTISPECIES: hypothetical protein [unclassified Myroides]MDM1045896.1 hypothetical protein [Myroides sp. R163-1]MDM1056906.1 hypothetical protein [Myroides sp. 1354]MDM1070101.1 hypothetical protein [Myroides sp. 1372]
MSEQTVYVLELDNQKAIHLDLRSLLDALETEFDNLHEDDFKTTVFKVYPKKMTDDEIDNLPEFDGF